MPRIGRLLPAAILALAGCQTPSDELTVSGREFTYTAENYDLWPVRTGYYEIQRLNDLHHALSAAGAECDDGVDIDDRAASVTRGIAWQGTIYRVRYRGRCATS